ncbi:unnamed protein product [Periconia digitata]|uniref:Rhodopsin domain-containing protein n=1 Tax=Periconia digitata TaxID=1303443 RepID=A0A9W4UXM2_9PLEO|nr:unnamed protein product [Periconia digitata]
MQLPAAFPMATDDLLMSMAMMAQEPLDPNEKIPLANRQETIYGATIPFHIISWAAVGFRLYTRFRVVREIGIDDYLIILAAFFNLASLIGVLCSLDYGLGSHFGFVLNEHAEWLTPLMRWLYIQNATYLTCSGIVKMSLLFQYFRMFKQGKSRIACQIVLGLVVLYTVTAFMQGWFPCFPANGFWDRLQTPRPKCWGLGYATIDGARMALYGFAATNMILDVIIFAIPMSVYWKPGIGRREIVALTALFALGSIVVLMAILRLWSVARHDAAGIQSFDFPWWFPLTLIFSALEVDFAIITASIPIFWPVIVRSLPQIFVTQEIHVTHHSRLTDNGNDFEMGRPQSLKSNNSQEGLTCVATGGKTDYNDTFVVDHVTGKTPQNRVEIAVRPPKKWGR